jgi:hypothetical protein
VALERAERRALLDPGVGDVLDVVLLQGFGQEASGYRPVGYDSGEVDVDKLQQLR